MHRALHATERLREDALSVGELLAAAQVDQRVELLGADAHDLRILIVRIFGSGGLAEARGTPPASGKR